MTQIGFAALLAPVVLGIYAYLGYPALLKGLALLGRQRPECRGADGIALEPAGGWPLVSITVPAFNEEAQIADTLDSLLSLDYPDDRREILVVSDASSDRTDDIVRSYGHRGVRLLRQPVRRGKTAAENAAALHLTGEIVVNTDASIRIAPDALKKLVAEFDDPRVGLASGADVSVSRSDSSEPNVGEAGYVDYEMRVRKLETRVSGIVGASGCFYAIRAELHRIPLPEALSRDFAAALNVTERGFRAVSVSDARCTVPRAPSLRREYVRKVRTMTRGMETLLHKRALLNPFRHGVFSWMLFSHKICRWALPVAAVAGVVGLGLLSVENAAARIGLWTVVAASAVGGASLLVSDHITLPRPLRMLAYAFAGNLAAIHALVRVLRGAQNAVWEPTRRTAAGSPTS